MSQAIITMLGRILVQLGGGTGGTGLAPTSIDKITRVLSFSTSTPLIANGVYTSAWVDAINYKSFSHLTAYSDVAGAYIVQFSDDGGITSVPNASVSVTASTLSTSAASVSRRYFRVVYTNSTTIQTSFSLSVYLSPI